ncbi:MAG: C25 family cysteine peptidase [candidate division WOR-3 bacterium]
MLSRYWLCLAVAGMALSQTGIDYLVVTPARFAPAFADFAFWKTRKGLRTEVVPVETIMARSSGRDRAEKVRNYLRLLHDSLGTSWVLLAGDTASVPTRMVFTPGNLTEYSPSDMYFSDLDGTWDEDHDNRFGEEEDSIDFFSDVYVGRVAAGDTETVRSLVEKWLEFERVPGPGFLMRLIRAGDTTQLVVPPGWFEGSISSPPTTQELRDSLNVGYQLAWHLGHSDGQALIVGGQVVLDIPGVQELTNRDKQCVLLTVGSQASAFDRQCIGSALVQHNQGGAVAVLANSRAGWTGISEILGYQFFHNLFGSETCYEAGRNQARTKDRFVNLARTQWRWRQALYLWNLLGEPNLPLWKEEPRELTVTHPATLDTGRQWFPIEVRSSGQPVRARVCLWKGEEVFERRWVWDKESIPIQPLTPGPMLVTVTANNHLPYEGVCGIGVGIGQFPTSADRGPEVLVRGGRAVLVSSFCAVTVELFDQVGRRIDGPLRLMPGEQQRFVVLPGVVLVLASHHGQAKANCPAGDGDRSVTKAVVVR